MKVLYCGFGRAGLECFYQLANYLQNKQSELFVFTHESDQNIEFVKHLEYNNICYTFSSINDKATVINDFQPDCLLSVYYRYIIKKDVLDAVNFKAMNLHPSLLPLYRGTKSSVWALINNELSTGITYHYINEEVDDGNIILQKELLISEEDTAFSLYHKLISLFVANFEKAFSLLINNYKGLKQKGNTTYYSRKLPFGGEIKFSETTYDFAQRFVRAMFFPPYKGAIFVEDNGEKLEICNLDELAKHKAKFKGKK